MSDAEFSLELIAGAGGFGSGEHPTTHLALQAMHALAAVQDFDTILDMGCGAGLLAMTAAHLWPQAEIIAADIQTSAVEISRRNITHNGMDGRIQVLRSNGYRHKAIQEHAPYGLVLCNITADPLVAMAGDLKKILAPEGVVVLSGILRWRGEEVLAVHAAQGLRPLLPPLAMGEWEAHVLAFADGD